MQPVTIFYWNANGLVANPEPKYEEIFRRNVDVIALTESHKVPPEVIERFTSKGYSLAACERREGDEDHGGVAVWVGPRLLAVQLKIDKPDLSNMEMVAVGLLPRGDHNATPLNMAVYYLSPRTGEGATAQTRLDGTKLGQWCSEVSERNSIHLLLGDANARHPMWCPGVASGKACTAKARGVALAEAIRDSMLTPLNLGATMAGSNTTPDVFLVRHPIEVRGRVRTNALSTDHLPVELTAMLRGFKAHKVVLRTYSVRWETVDWRKVNDSLERATSRVTKCQNPQTAWSYVHRAITREIRGLATHGRVRTREKVPAAITQKINEARSKCESLQTTGDREQMSEIIREVSEAIVEWRTMEMEREAHTLSHATHRKSFGRDLWRFSRANELSRPPALQTSGGGALGAAEMTRRFAKAWGEKHTATRPETEETEKENVDPEALETHCRQWMEKEPVTAAEVRTALLELNMEQCADTIGIKPVFLLNMSDGMMQRIAHTFSLLLANGWAPREMKESQGIPLPKIGKDLAEVDGYRPVAITLLLSRVLEGIVVRRIQHELEKRGIRFHPNQFGFIRGKTVSQAVLAILGEIANLLSHKGSGGINQRVVVIPVDMTDAYCKVDKEEVDRQLGEWQVPLIYRKWLRNFLSDRTMRVFTAGHLGGTVPLATGVPQGSAIGPFLWIVVMESLLKRLERKIQRLSLKANFAAYADDLTIWTYGDDPAGVLQMARQIMLTVDEWACETGMVLSKKTVAMMCTASGARALKNKPAAPEFITNKSHNWDMSPGGLNVSTSLTIPFVETARILGITIDHHASTSPHASKVATDCEARLARLKKEIFCLPPPVRSMVVDGLVGSKIRSMLPTWWNRVGAKAKGELEGVWHRMAVTITGAHSTASSLLVVAEAGLRPLDTTALLTGLSLAQKIWAVPKEWTMIRGRLGSNAYIPACPERNLQSCATGRQKEGVPGASATRQAVQWHTTPDPSIGNPLEREHRESIEVYLSDCRSFFKNMVHPPRFHAAAGRVREEEKAHNTHAKRVFNGKQLSHAEKCHYLIHTDASIGRIKDPELVAQLGNNAKAIRGLPWLPASGGAFLVLKRNEDGSLTEVGRGELSLGETACSFSMERETILESLRYVQRHLPEWTAECPDGLRIGLVTDSLSTLTQLEANGPFGQVDGQAEAIWEVMINMHTHHNTHLTMMFVYSHAGTTWNEVVDRRAKEALHCRTQRPLWTVDVARALRTKILEMARDFRHPTRIKYDIKGPTNQRQLRRMYLKRFEAILLMQLRTGANAELGGHLHGQMDICYCCRERSSVEKGRLSNTYLTVWGQRVSE